MAVFWYVGIGMIELFGWLLACFGIAVFLYVVGIWANTIADRMVKKKEDDDVVWK